jgi:hypothetical protein
LAEHEIWEEFYKTISSSSSFIVTFARKFFRVLLGAIAIPEFIDIRANHVSFRHNHHDKSLPINEREKEKL